VYGLHKGQRLDSLEQLVAQIRLDISVARRALAEISAVPDSITRK